MNTISINPQLSLIMNPIIHMENAITPPLFIQEENAWVYLGPTYQAVAICMNKTNMPFNITRGSIFPMDMQCAIRTSKDRLMVRPPNRIHMEDKRIITPKYLKQSNHMAHSTSPLTKQIQSASTKSISTIQQLFP